MKRITSILMVGITLLFLSSCGGGIENKIQGKWQWISAESSDGTEPLAMTGQQYFLFKKGKYLYMDYSGLDVREDWDANSLPYEINTETKVITIWSADKTTALKHYKISFKDKNTLLLTVDDAGEFYGEIWKFKKMK